MTDAVELMVELALYLIASGFRVYVNRKSHASTCPSMMQEHRDDIMTRTISSTMLTRQAMKTVRKLVLILSRSCVINDSLLFSLMYPSTQDPIYFLYCS
ncbi:MAG TPA: hypothetical protein VKM55_19810 [Candidatus Lokiarchaeia archaeon]|nr:hypothetical protein [Candidatus Lokiarchaeia archaeon]